MFYKHDCRKTYLEELKPNMIAEKTYLEELEPYSNSYVNFGDGTRRKIKGIGKMVYPGLPCLDDVLLVEGLTTNLINVS